MQRVIFIIENLVAGFSLWLGLYIITRDLPDPDGLKWWERPGFLAGVGMSLVSLFFFGVALQTFAPKDPYVLIQRVTWWPIPIAVGLWFWVVIQLASEGTSLEQKRWIVRGVPLLVLVYAVGVAVVGSATDVMFDYQGADKAEHWAIFSTHFIDNKPGHVFYSAYVVVLLLIAAVLLGWKVRSLEVGSERRAAMLSVALAGGLFLLGGSVSIFGYSIHNGIIPEQVGDFIVFLGLLMFARGIRQRNSLRLREWRDLGHSLVGVACVVMLYLVLIEGVYWGLGGEQDFFLPSVVLLLTIVTHTGYDAGRIVYNRAVPKWLIPPGLVRLYGYLYHIRLELGTSSDRAATVALIMRELAKLSEEVSREEIKQWASSLVDGEVLEHRYLYTDPDRIANSGLRNMLIVQRRLGVTEAERTVAKSEAYARAVRELLIDTVEEQLPADKWVTPRDEAWWKVGLVIIYWRYLVDAKQFVARTEMSARFAKETGDRIDGNTYQRRLQAGREWLVNHLYEEELKAREMP